MAGGGEGSRRGTIPRPGRQSTILGAAIVALVGITLLPWGDIGGVPQRGNGVAEHLFAVPDVKGTIALPLARVLGLAWYVATAGLVAAVALVVFLPARSGWIRATLTIATMSSVLLACAMFFDEGERLTIGSSVTLVAAAVATWFSWRR